VTPPAVPRLDGAFPVPAELAATTRGRRRWARDRAAARRWLVLTGPVTAESAAMTRGPPAAGPRPHRRPDVAGADPPRGCRFRALRPCCSGLEALHPTTAPGMAGGDPSRCRVVGLPLYKGAVAACASMPMASLPPMVLLCFACFACVNACLLYFACVSALCVNACSALCGSRCEGKRIICIVYFLCQTICNICLYAFGLLCLVFCVQK
jgi:hypothetical protein